MKQTISTAPKYKLKLLPHQYLALRVLKYSFGELKDFVINELKNEYFFETSDEKKPLEVIKNKSQTFEEHLLHQLSLEPLSEYEVTLGKEIIGNLNDDGYLIIPLEEIAKSLDAAARDLEKILHVIQEFEPAGVGARSLSECLLIQLRAQNNAASLEYKIAEKYLKELGSKKFELLSKKLKTDEKDIREAAARLAKLNPRPGSIFTPVSMPVIPDLILQKKGNNFVLTLNRETELLSRLTTDYNLIKAIQKRNQTLKRIAEYITQNQKEFLKAGFSKLKPLTMEKFARDLAAHKSTISRAIADKYVQTYAGAFKLKDLFSKAIKTKNGGFLSAKAIKEIIKRMLEKEDNRRPLTDQMIKERLCRRGINISRRVITKYRQELKILPAYLRK